MIVQTFLAESGFQKLRLNFHRLKECVNQIIMTMRMRKNTVCLLFGLVSQVICYNRGREKDKRNILGGTNYLGKLTGVIYFQLQASYAQEVCLDMEGVRSSAVQQERPEMDLSLFFILSSWLYPSIQQVPIISL